MSDKKKVEHSDQWWAERRREYIAKNDLLMESHPDWEFIPPIEFYRVLFPEGFLETKGVMIDWDEPGGGKPNAIALQFTNEFYKAKTKAGKEYDKRRIKRFTITDDLDGITERVSDSNDKNEAVFCAPVSYFGKARNGGNARFLHAFAIDLDGVGPQELSNVLKQISNGYDPNLPRWTSLPQPTFLVNSGTGFHLYYVLEKPIPLHPRFVPFLEEFKDKLTDYIWRDTTSQLEEKQFQGIYQAFRMPGTPTKLNGKTADSKIEDKYEAVAFCHYVGEGWDRKPYLCSLEYLLGYAGSKNDGKDAEELLKLMETGGKTPIEQAKGLWPEWYQTRIVEGRKANGRWTNNRALYDWWLKRIKDEATDHHRYWCLNALASYADKCGVPYDELERDALALVPHLESLTTREDNHFSEQDALAAIQGYGDGSMHKLKVETISRRSAIGISRNKRNGQKQVDHLEEARAIRDIRQRRKKANWWDDGNRNGAPTKRDEIMAYAAEHPEASQRAIAKALGVSPTTVNKWLKPDAVVAPPADNAEGSMSIEEAVEKAIDEHLSLLIRKHGQVIMTDREDLDSEGVLVDRLKKGGDWAFGRFFERVAEENGKCRNKLSDQGLIDKPMQLKL